MKYLQLILIFLLAEISAHAQSGKNSEISFATFNLDNFYDINDDPYDTDNDYTSKGRFFWGEDRYKRKKEALTEVIKSISPGTFPEILILTGFENNRVIDDLLSDRSYRKSAYKSYFAPGEFKAVILSTENIVKDVRFKNLALNNEPEFEQYILYAELEFINEDIIHVFINNWSERKAGADSERERIRCAVALRKEIDNILNFERDAGIIVTGTFFDEPTSKSVMSVLNATNKRKNLDYRDLYNPFYDIHNNNNLGTYEINGKLHMFDFTIVSAGLLRKREGYQAGFNQASIVTGDNSTPAPTFRGEEYVGGAGRYFPVLINLTKND